MNHLTCTHANDAADTNGDGERCFVFSESELRALGTALVQAAGPDSARDALFRLGRSWGDATATRTALRGTRLRERFERALAHMASLGLGYVALEQFDVAPERRACRIAGRIDRPLRIPTAAAGARRTSSACELSSGFLTGLTVSLTGLDVLCTPLDGDVLEDRVPFEILPVSATASRQGEGCPPPGSARFYLGALGRVMTDYDLSLDDLIERSSDAVVLIDARQIVRFWSRGAEDLFQWLREEVVGRRVGFIVPRELIESDELGSIQRRLEHGEPVRNMITRRMRKDGVVLEVSLTRTLLHDSRGQVIGSTATIRDITEQRRTEAALARSRTLAIVGELAAKVAHEIKNPLAGIYAAMHCLLRDFAPGDARHKVIESVQREVRRLDDTVLEILHFARPEQPRPRPSDLRRMIENVVEPLQSMASAHRIEFVLDVDRNIVVPVDGRMLAQVFGNLILNALQAIGEGGTITVSARASGPQAAIEVRDTGPGIAPDVQRRLFEPFVTTKSRGTGLGLAIAKKNIELHGGTIAADNPPEGGARFRFELPRVEGPFSTA